MTDTVHITPVPLIRRSFMLIVFASFTVVGIVFWYLTAGVDGGGQTAESPDGKFLMVVWRTRNYPYQVTLRDYQSGQILREFSVHAIEKMPSQELRGGPRVIAWDLSSQFADLTFDGQLYCRIYVPNDSPQSGGVNDP